MRQLIFSFALTVILSACQADETVHAYGGAGKAWHLTELDGQPFTAHATLTFPEPGQIAGKAPCNRYFGPMTAPYPWFRADQIATTRRACPDLDEEARFLTALSEMTLSEISGPVLLLSNDAGRTMTFRTR